MDLQYWLTMDMPAWMPLAGAGILAVVLWIGYSLAKIATRKTVGGISNAAKFFRIGSSPLTFTSLLLLGLAGGGAAIEKQFPTGMNTVAGATSAGVILLSIIAFGRWCYLLTLHPNERDKA